MSAGDSSLESARRELEEELGLAPEPSQFNLLFTTKIESFQNNNTYINREYIDVYLIGCFMCYL